MNCCKQECKTPFCPLCGKPLGGTSINGLRRHVAITAGAAIKRLSRAERELRRAESPPSDPEIVIKGRQSRVDKATANMERWKAWDVALTELCEEKSIPIESREQP